jgi:cytochrome c
MKTIIATLGIAALLSAAGANAAIDEKKATELMAKANCNACHQIAAKTVGPAYKDVSKKYKGDAKAADALFAKARAGGSGVWGPIPMPPNPKEKISDEELKSLIGWILTL